MKFPSLRALFQFAGRKIVVKFVLAFSAIMLIPLIITVQIVTDTINAKLLELEISKQNEIMNNMKAYLNEQYEKISMTLYLIYFPAGNIESPVEQLMSSNRNESEYNALTRGRVSIYLNGLLLSKDEIVDIILLDNHDRPHVYSTSNRSVSINKDFHSIERIRSIRPEDNRIFVFPDQSPDYIIGGNQPNQPVISHVGNLYEINEFTLTDPVGKYIINLSMNEILTHYREISDNNPASFYMLQEDGTILFSNDMQAIGTKHPFFGQIAHTGAQEWKVDGEVYLVNKTRLAHLGHYLLMQVPKRDVLKGTRQLIRDILTVFFAGVALILLLSYLFSSFLASRIKKLNAAMRSVERGNFGSFIESKSDDEFGQLIASFNRMCARLEEYVNKVYVAEIESKNAKLSSLQSAINPHFLYNTLEAIRMKAVEDRSKDVSHMLYLFGRLFHWRIGSDHAIITIEEELHSINWYLELLKFRYRHNLETIVRIDESLYEYGIPKLLLQPIIENAFNHGLFRKAQKSVLLIRGSRSGDRIVFEIIDNGVGLDGPQLAELQAGIEGKSHGKRHIGLANVAQRIQVMFGPSHQVKIASRKNYWTKVSVSIPMMSRKEMEASVQALLG
jgi:two-component system sensor histidine kinase YesM